MNTFTLEHAGLALRRLRETTRDASPERTALNKAALNLVACHWSYDGTTLKIASASVTKKAYHVVGDRCDCPAARRTCWHRSALAVLALAEQLARPAGDPVRARMTDAEYARTLEAVDELF